MKCAADRQVKRKESEKQTFSFAFNQLKKLVILQFKESFNTSWMKDSKSKTIHIVLSILKFLGVAAITSVLCLLINVFGLVLNYRLVDFLALFLFAYFILSTLSSMSGCCNKFFLAEDNKVLVTLPASSGTLFLSKIIVYFLNEMTKAIYFLFPVTLGMIIFGMFPNIGQTSIWPCFWMFIPLTLFVLTYVLFGAILSVPYLFVKKFLKKVPQVEVGIACAVLIAVVVLVFLAISKIPADLDLQVVWGSIKGSINDFLYSARKAIAPIDYFVQSIVGVLSYGKRFYHGFRLDILSFGYFGILLASLAVVFVIVYFAIKPLFLAMMTKSVDYDKDSDDQNVPNVVHKKYPTFVFKEMKLQFRTFDISITYLLVYISVPIMIFLLDHIYDAIYTSMRGDMLTSAFNILIILLPLLASNSMVSSAYSKEGRAGYIKKTKPINPLFPLLSKFIFNLVFSLISIIASVLIFGIYAHMDVLSVIFVGLSILLTQFAHIIYSATLDIMHPKNEMYATDGDVQSNANENISSILAFVVSAIMAFLAYFFFNESVNNYGGSFIPGSIRLLIISIILFGSCALLFTLKIKAFYYEK